MLLAIITFIGAFLVAMILLGLLSPGKRDEEPAPTVVLQPQPLRRNTTFHLADFQKTALLSAVPWLNRWLHSFAFGPTIRVLLNQADLKWTAGRFLLMSLAAGAAAALVSFEITASVALGILVGAAVAVLPFVYLYIRRSRRFSLIEQQLPSALDMISSALRAGHSFNAALGTASRECSEPIKAEFKTTFDEQNFGLDLPTALENLVNRVPLQDVRISTTAILIQKECGGNLAEVLTNTSQVIRERFRLKRQIRVHTAHGRITGWVISILPLVLLIVLYVVNPSMESILWKREIGVRLLWGGGAMMALGVVAIQRIIRLEV